MGNSTSIATVVFLHVAMLLFLLVADPFSDTLDMFVSRWKRTALKWLDDGLDQRAQSNITMDLKEVCGAQLS
jgi:hypothetical protein